jgi:hypothetical protein
MGKILWEKKMSRTWLCKWGVVEGAIAGPVMHTVILSIRVKTVSWDPRGQAMEHRVWCRVSSSPFTSLIDQGHRPSQTLN